MAIQTVKTGAAVNDGTGDDARTAFTKINQNFTDSTNAASCLIGNSVGQIAVNRFLDNAALQFNDKDFVATTGMQYAYTNNQNKPGWANDGAMLNLSYSADYTAQLFMTWDSAKLALRGRKNGTWGAWTTFWGTNNTTTDGNGFIKAASPIVKLFSDKIELNDEANLQPITFEKLGVGDYLVKGSLGFAQEGWYIEMPKDANGNVLVAVVYEQLENNDISVKTYAKMFDPDTGDIVANTAKPRDIPATRWIDLRLQALPQPDITPFDNQETVITDA